MLQMHLRYPSSGGFACFDLSGTCEFKSQLEVLNCIQTGATLLNPLCQTSFELQVLSELDISRRISSWRSIPVPVDSNCHRSCSRVQPLQKNTMSFAATNKLTPRRSGSKASRKLAYGLKPPSSGKFALCEESVSTVEDSWWAMLLCLLLPEDLAESWPSWQEQTRAEQNEIRSGHLPRLLLPNSQGPLLSAVRRVKFKARSAWE